jgi:small conductance mechanosensitive channel
MHERMSLLQSANPCEDGEQICHQAFMWTGNATVADVADVVIGKPLAIAGLLLFGLVLRWLLHRIIDRVIRRAETGVLPDRVNLATSTRRVQRAQTMGSLLKSIVTGVLVAVFGTMILSELGVNIAPIIASAGIIGLALGFGAQSLVKDFLSGVFMIFEDQYGVGDVVDIGEASGTVEAVTLRITRLRDLHGTVWYVPNGEIMRVGNMSQNWARAVIDVAVGYGEDLARVKRVILEVAEDLYQDDEFRELIIEEPEVTGVEMLAADSVTLRVMFKTLPMEQWAVGREMRQRVKARFDHEGIEIPFAQRVVWHREAKAAAAQDSEPAEADADSR